MPSRIRELFTALKNHDWLAHMSEDKSVIARARGHYERVIVPLVGKVGRRGPEFLGLYTRLMQLLHGAPVRDDTALASMIAGRAIEQAPKFSRGDINRIREWFVRAHESDEYFMRPDDWETNIKILNELGITPPPSAVEKAKETEGLFYEKA